MSGGPEHIIEPQKLPPIFWAIIILYLFGMLFVGGYVSRRIKNTRGFFIAEGRLNPIVVGLSLMATYLSALTMMALSGIAFGSADMTWAIQLPFLILTAFVITRFVLPRYREAGVISVYEYLERRIHVSSRLMASFCFILLSIGRMGLVLFLPALAFHIVTGASLPLTIIVMGIVVTLYTVLGGIEAVVWTDAIQAVIFSMAAVLTIGYIFFDVHAAGGDFWLRALTPRPEDHGYKLRIIARGLDYRQVVTAWLILQTIFETIRIYGTQQDMTQRYMTTRSTAEANRSVWIAICGYIPLGFLFYFIGAALAVYYQVQPDPNVPALVAAKRSDAIYPYFVVTRLPVGTAGLVIAAIFAAAMSSIDSSMNSASTVCVEDFYKRFVSVVTPAEHRKLALSDAPPRTAYLAVVQDPDRHCLRVARGLTVLWGGLATYMALLFMNIASAQVAWSKIMGISTNGILGLMALAFLPFRVHRWAAVLGFVACYEALFIMMYCTKVNFLLWPVVGNLVCFFVALALNKVFSRDEQRRTPVERTA
ncbi:MAG: sodium/solute symporter [Armatimonadota bacterium]